MKITKLDIHSFRLFKDVSLTLGSRITVITGTNAVGKSTILGLLGNSSELKKKEGAPILKPRFRCEFSEIFKMSQEFDKKSQRLQLLPLILVKNSTIVYLGKKIKIKIPIVVV